MQTTNAELYAQAKALDDRGEAHLMRTIELLDAGAPTPEVMTELRRGLALLRQSHAIYAAAREA